MNSLLHLGRCLGDVSSQAFQRHCQYRLVQSLDHQDVLTFSYLKSRTSQIGVDDDTLSSSTGQEAPETAVALAHQSGTNCLTVDPQTSRFLITGGADSTIRLWDLESNATSNPIHEPFTYSPTATLSRSNPSAHTHALTSLSTYPFDPVPTTLLSTAYDNALLLTSITPSSLTPVHKINLDFTPYTHTISPHPSSSPLVAVGTSHPAVRLVDLRSGLATHSLPGHNGAVYALAFSPSPSHPHLLISGSTDSRILLFDIRRANPAFASLDLDDAIGYPTLSHTHPSESRPAHLHLNYSANAHSGPVTGLTFSLTDPNSPLISTGHDSRIRLWDLTTGRNELIHFGPRIRNSRNGNLSPLLLPAGTAVKPARETLLWPNDDGRGEIFHHSMREGTMLNVLKTRGVDRSNTNKKGETVRKLTRKGRINALALRMNGESGHGVEIYSAHGDGSVCAWFPQEPAGQDDEIKDPDDPDRDDDDDNDDHDHSGGRRILTAEQSSKKRKRDLIGDLVQGLTKKPVRFS